MNVGYVRVSTAEQNEERQVRALEAHGIKKWYKEKISGKDRNRPQLQTLLDFGKATPSTLNQSQD